MPTFDEIWHSIIWKDDLDDYNRDGFNTTGFDHDGYDRNGFDMRGFNREGYNRYGYDKYGYNRDGLDRDFLDENGYDREGYRVLSSIWHRPKCIIEKVMHKERSEVRYARKKLPKKLLTDAERHDEIRLMSEAKHNHVMPIVTNYSDENFQYIVMPYCSEDLSQWLTSAISDIEDNIHMIQKTTNPFSIMALDGNRRTGIPQWIFCLATLVRHLHTCTPAAIRHCDIKPQNILIHENRKLLLADFELAYSSPDDTFSGSTGSVGTVRYLPPETQVLNRQMDRIGKKADIWALGCVFYELLYVMSLPYINNGKGLPRIEGRYSVEKSKSFDYGDLNDPESWQEDPELLERLDLDNFQDFVKGLGPYVWKSMLDENPDSRASADNVWEKVRELVKHKAHPNPYGWSTSQYCSCNRYLH